MWYIRGVNSMGSTWYLDNKEAKECTLWSEAPKEMRAVYDDKEEAKRKVRELDEAFRFATTRHSIVPV